MFLLIVLILGIIALYFGYKMYIENSFIRFYDGDTVRYLEIPPFASRKSPADHELFGQCILKVSLVPDQAIMNIAAACQKRGFFMRDAKNGFEIEIAPKYIVRGRVREGVLELSWTPGLTEAQKKKAEKMTAPSPLVSPLEGKKKKP